MFEFNVVMTTGSNVELEWFLDSSSTCLEEYSGTFRSSVRNHTFTSPLTNNITVVAANSVHRTYKHVIVESIYGISGYNITTESNAPHQTGSVSFVVTLDPSAPSETGDVTVEVDYGTGSPTNISLTSYISQMKTTAGHSLSQSYPEMGNFTATFKVFNSLSSQSFEIGVYVWNAVDATFMADSLNINASQTSTFNFQYSGTYGFNYRIDYGDGSPVVEYIDPDSWSSAYNSTPFTHTYSGTGAYLVTSTAWNPFYISVCDFTINVEDPIPDDLALDPSQQIIIPYPDGLVDFIIAMPSNVASPTNVTCDFDYGDGTQETGVDTVFEYGGNGVKKTHNYTTAGTKSVLFNCSNLVSAIELAVDVVVKTFTLNDFVITFPSVVSMNTTSEQNSDGIYVAASELSSVNFTISLFSGAAATIRLPPNIFFTWDFGDNTAQTRDPLDPTDFWKVHTYELRGDYTITITMEDVDKATNLSPTYSITMGVVQFNVNPTEGEVGTTQFSYTATGLGGVGDFELDYGDSTTPKTDSAVAQLSATTKSFSNNGVYHSYVIVTNDSFYERVYLPEALKVDYPLDPPLVVLFSNNTVDFPPGSIEVNVTLPSGQAARPNVTCKVPIYSVNFVQLVITISFKITYLYIALL